MSAAHPTTAMTTCADTASVTNNNTTDMSKNRDNGGRFTSRKEAPKNDVTEAIGYKPHFDGLSDRIAKLERQVELNTSAIDVLKSANALLQQMDRDAPVEAGHEPGNEHPWEAPFGTMTINGGGAQGEWVCLRPDDPRLKAEPWRPEVGDWVVVLPSHPCEAFHGQAKHVDGRLDPSEGHYVLWHGGGGRVRDLRPATPEEIAEATKPAPYTPQFGDVVEYDGFECKVVSECEDAYGDWLLCSPDYHDGWFHAIVKASELTLIRRP